MHIGKVLGALVGLLAFSNLYATVLCTALGFLFDKIFTEAYLPKLQILRWRQSFSYHYICLHAKLAKADGVVTPEEISLFQECCEIQITDKDVVAHLYNNARARKDGFERHAQALFDLSKNDPETLMRVVESLMYVVHHSNGTEEQSAVVQATSNIFGFSVSDFQQMQARVCSGEGGSRRTRSSQNEDSKGELSVKALKDAYKALGLKSKATKVEVKKRYRSLIREGHPDKLRGEGASEAELKKAESQMVKWNDAYNVIMADQK